MVLTYNLNELHIIVDKIVFKKKIVITSKLIQ